MFKTRDETFAPPDEQISNWYHVTGRSGIYVRPSEILGEVMIFRKEGMMTTLEWMFGQLHQHLHAVNMAGKHGIRLPGLLIVPSETEKKFTILWRQPGRERLATTLDFKQHELPNTVMNVQQAREVDVLHLFEQSERREVDKTGTIVQANLPVQETRSAGGMLTSNAILSRTSHVASERIRVTAWQACSVTWDLTVDGDDIVLRRLSSVGMVLQVPTQISLRFNANSTIEVRRYNTGLHVRFLRCGSSPRMAPDVHLPGDSTREYIDDATYHIVRSPLVEREHHDDGTESVPSSWCTTEGENEGREDANLQEQSRQDIYYDAKSHFSELSGELDVSEEPWEIFVRALKRVVKAAGGTFTRLADR
ncbi:unnamed protein product [Alternaria burnsii]|nr:unnamed protein product [Alternaria burnsii]